MKDERDEKEEKSGLFLLKTTLPVEKQVNKNPRSLPNCFCKNLTSVWNFSQVKIVYKTTNCSILFFSAKKDYLIILNLFYKQSMPHNWKKQSWEILNYVQTQDDKEILATNILILCITGHGEDTFSNSVQHQCCVWQTGGLRTFCHASKAKSL